MFNRFDPTVNAVIAFLRFLSIEVNISTVDETLQSHPDWPSLLCISDALHKWNVPNGAGKIDKTEIDTLPTPFLASTDKLEVVVQLTDNEVKLYSNNKNVTETRERFLKRWNGIYLIAEKRENSGEKRYNSVRRGSFIAGLIPTALIVLLSIITFLFLLGNISKSIADNIFGVYLQYVILLIGVVVTTLLLWHEIDSNNPILKKVCSGIVKGNCDAILSGKQSKVFSWLSWSEVGFFYFAGGLLSLLLVSPLVLSLSIVAYMNILALPYTVFSIYYQGRIAKQWCLLCLSVQALLLLGGINVFVNGFFLPLSLSFTAILQCGLFYLLPLAAWYTLKPYLLRLQEAKNTKREYLRIKFNTEIFETLLKKQRTITVPTDGLGIDLGNPAATNQLVKVCNPYCGPCAGVHPKIEKLLEEIPNLKVKIIFTSPNNLQDKAYQPVSHLLAIAAQNSNEETIKQALDAWYLAPKKDYTLFATKYPIEDTLQEQSNKIEAMHKWCVEMKISYTPTIFINGYELPAAYSIQDLNYFLLEA